MVLYSFALELIRQKMREDSFDVGYQNQRLPRTSHKWVESEVKPEVNPTYKGVNGFGSNFFKEEKNICSQVPPH